MKKVTMKDVAAAAGVSVAAVSRVMNGSGYVAPDKREAILQAISTVGYRAQRVPPGPQTPLIGLILRSANGLPYFSQLSEALMSEASAKGFNTMLFYCDSVDNDTLLKRLEIFQNYNISGLVVGGFGPNALRDDVCMYLRAANVPVVLLERSPECRGVNRVLIDNESGMYTAARYLLDQGHKEIVYLNRDLDSDVEKDRLHGFLRAMQAAPDVKYWVNNGKTSSPRTAFTALEQLKSRLTWYYRCADLGRYLRRRCTPIPVPAKPACTAGCGGCYLRRYLGALLGPGHQQCCSAPTRNGPHRCCHHQRPAGRWAERFCQNRDPGTAVYTQRGLKSGMGALCCHYCSTIFVYAILNHQNVAKTFRSLYNMDIIKGKGGLDR